jgi:hypothetical protein
MDLGMKKSSQSVRLETVLKSQTTAAMEMMSGSVTARPAKKLRRKRAKKLFLTR